MVTAEKFFGWKCQDQIINLNFLQDSILTVSKKIMVVQFLYVQTVEQKMVSWPQCNHISDKMEMMNLLGKEPTVMVLHQVTNV